MSEAIHYPSQMIERARELHKNMVVLDSHIDLPLGFGHGDLQPDRDGPTQFDLVKVSEGEVSGVVLTVAAGAGQTTNQGRTATLETAEKKYKIITEIFDRFPDKIGLAKDPDTFISLVKEGKLAAVLGFQNALPLGDDLYAVETWVKRGVRQFAFTFIGNNQWADSARPYPYIGRGLHSSGLSGLGRDAVGRLNDLGVIIDVSQASAEALRDILETSRAPVVASHSAPRASVDTDRNLSDQEIAAIAKAGGVIQVVAFGPYLVPLSNEVMHAIGGLWQQYGLKRPTDLSSALSINDPETANWDPRTFDEFLHEFHVVLKLEKPVATVSDLVDAIEHTVKIAGINHVGIASDFNHSGGVIGWMHAGETLNVTAELLKRSFKEGDIAKLWGKNYLRLWRDVRSLGK